MSRAFLGYVLVLALSVFLENLSDRASTRARALAQWGVSPIRATAGSAARLSGTVGAWFRHRSLRVENAALARTITELRLDHDRVLSLIEENTYLKSLLRFKRTSPYNLEAAEVTARDEVSGWWRLVRINKGRADGVVPGLAVIVPAGLVGKTVSASQYSAEVLLLTDPTCKIGCRLPRTGLLGLAEGRGVSAAAASPLRMCSEAQPSWLTFGARGPDVREGDDVLTSGLGDVYPRGLRVGRVAACELHASGLFRRALVTPAADVAHLWYVFVVKPGPNPTLISARPRQPSHLPGAAPGKRARACIPPTPKRAI